MGLWFSIAAAAALALIGWFGGEIASLNYIFGVIIPYAAIAVFIIGIIYRVVKWAKSPVPFKIPTTGGQQKSLDFIRQNKFDSPYTGWQTFWRMVLEVLTFRSLFRNTKAEIKEGGKLVYGSAKWLWFFALVFHWSFLIIVLRHFRFFTEPVPAFVPLLQNIDGFLQVGLPVIYMTDAAILIALTYLFFRRVFDGKIKYISLASDYFPLVLILLISVSGLLMRYLIKTDLVAIKELTAGLFTFAPVIAGDISPLFYMHLFLVSVLLIYFPMSKLMHMPGVFLSPTRNLPNNNRAVRHVNPWNPDVEVHTYEEYEDEFRPLMKAAGLPLEKDDEDNKEEKNVN
ncbi:MAG: sulfate reduction electron transfer complex DsrMKJOP subunit DsrM [Candidatus Kapaibacterium sp.]